MSDLIRLNDFISNQIVGDWGKEKEDDRNELKVYCIRGADINDVNEGKYLNLPIRYIESKNKIKILKEGNIIIEISGGSPSQSTGRVCYVKSNLPNIICSNFCRAYEIKSEHSSKFFYYLIKNIYNSDVFYNFESKTTGIKNLLIESALDNIKVPKYNLPTQQSIAKVLSDLDDKIELNNKINKELESMAKTLYDYWFVQFDFPNEEGKPYKSSGGKMVYKDELNREIPEGWEVKSISEWIKNNKSGDWGQDIIKGNYKLKVNCIRGADINGLKGNDLIKAPERYIQIKNSDRKLVENDLIVEISGGSPTQSTGRIAFITVSVLNRFQNPLICSNFCKALTLNDEKYLYNFFYQWERLYENGVLFDWEGKTSGIKNLLFESFISNHFEPFPNRIIVEKFYLFARSIHTEKQKNITQNQQLAEMRDWLLPMLMNGQVTVYDTPQKLDNELRYSDEIKNIIFNKKTYVHNKKKIQQ